MQNPDRSLPSTSLEAQEHSLTLSRKIADQIQQAGGAIPFTRFMQMALYEPGLGYYSAGAHKFGSAGDFITAPELTPLFGAALANQITDIHTELGSYSILEFGAGSGRLAADLLFELQQKEALPDQYLIMEISADLRERQRLTLLNHCPQLVDRVIWLDQLPDQAFDGVILANEVLDAMPVQRFQIGTPNQELSVMLKNNRSDQPEFAWTYTPEDTSLETQIDHIQSDLPQPLPDSYQSEWNPNLPGWIASLTAVLRCGVILCVDYGETRREYYHPDRLDGTLRCYYRHRTHSDPFQLIGLQDITASVDFTALAEAAVANDLDVEGYTSQAMFLMNCGLLDALQNTLDENSAESPTYLKNAQAVKTLTLPGEMGERFKVMALGKNLENPLRGFAMGDRRDAL